MVREIVIWPDPVLKQVAAPVDRVDDTVRRLLDDMADTMYAADGVGLAAPQVGVGKRVIVIDTSPRQPEQKLIHLVNPEIVKTEGKTIVAEGDLLAIALQHEVDHLEGTVFVDHLSSLKRELIRKRMKKLKAERAADVAEDVKRAPRHESAL